jgi:predicted O-methyltransferase YrrM
MVGLNMREPDQLELVKQFANYRAEYDALPIERTDQPYQFYHNNGLYGWVDAIFLYCILRVFNPRRVYEIGSGYSTLLAAQALAVNASEAPQSGYRELVAIEPYPRDFLAGLPGLTRIIRVPVQQVDLAEFEQLDANDVLFIDSSHVLKAGSDVQHEYLEILPRLQPGVLVHAHDIFLPREYPEQWLRQKQRFWNEQYLLQAFLAFNEAFEVVLSAAYLHTERPHVLSAACSFYDPAQGSPGSFWFRRRM